MAQVSKVRLPDGRVLTPGDWTAAVALYSTIEISTGPIATLSAFSYGLGADVPGSFGPRASTLADTNLEGEGARLPENEELIIYNIAVEVFQIGAANDDDDIAGQTAHPDVSLSNMLRMQRDMLVIFRIAAVKEYTRSPLSYWPASTGVHQYNSAARAVATTTGYVASNNGSTSAADGRTLASPLYVAGGESISVDFKAGPGSVVDLDLDDNSRMRLRTYLDGYRRRPVA